MAKTTFDMDKSTGDDFLEKEQAYYLTYDIDGDNACRTEREIIVNCCGITTMTKPFKTIRQKGREDFFILFLVGGRLDVYTDLGRETLEPGQMITYYPHSPCIYQNDRKEPVQYYWAHFTGNRAGELLEKCRIGNRGMISLLDMTGIIADFEQLFQEFSKREACFDFLVFSLLTAILTKTDQNRAGEKSMKIRRSLQQAITYIHTNYQNSNISVEHLADIEHLSPSRFRTIFKENTGASPKEYILNHKINQAKRLLAQTNLSIKEISLETGNGDQLYFSRIFRRKTGLTPSGYRQYMGKRENWA